MNGPTDQLTLSTPTPEAVLLDGLDPQSLTGLSVRCGRLWAAVEALLEVIDELPEVLDPFHEIKVRHARRILDEVAG